MNLTQIQEGLPSDLRNQLLSDEKVFYFSFITFKGGCGSPDQRENYWIALTDKRVIYKTKIVEMKGQAKGYVEKDGILPFEKISFIEVSEIQVSQGCSSTKAFQLIISTSGGQVAIPLPTKDKGYEIRRVFSELNQKEN